MANFDQSQAKRNSVRDANNLLDLIRNTYQSAKAMQTLLARYQAGTDSTFNAAVNALYTPAERQELGAMLNQAAALVTDWETSHPAAIAYEEPVP